MTGFAASFESLEALFLLAPVQGLLGQWWGQRRQFFLPQVLGWGAWCGACLDGFLGYAGALWVTTGTKASGRAKLKFCSFFWAYGGAFFLAPVRGPAGAGVAQGWRK